MYSIRIQPNWESWRTVARQLLKQKISPMQVFWQTNDTEPDLFKDALDFANTHSSPALPLKNNSVDTEKKLRVPADFIALGKMVACHANPEKWDLLYRLIWRITLGNEPHLLKITSDPDVVTARRFEKAISREIHKTHAFVRFRLFTFSSNSHDVNDNAISLSSPHSPNPNQSTHKTSDRGLITTNHHNETTAAVPPSNESVIHSQEEAREYYTAWFEPDHFIVEPSAPFFVKRFSNMDWSILTPKGCAHWIDKQLVFTPGIPKDPIGESDSQEELWKTYYASIFNPARVKLNAMRKEMPKRYWHNLPEAELIPPLTQQSTTRVNTMLSTPLRPPARKLKGVRR